MTGKLPGKYYGRLKGIHGTPVQKIWLSRHVEPDFCTGVEFWPPTPRDMEKHFYQRDCIAFLMRHLSKQMRRVIYLRFFHGMTLRIVAYKLELTPERIRQIEVQAIRRIRWLVIKNPDIFSPLESLL